MITRRKLLNNSLILGCSAAASPFITPISLLAAPTDNRFVVIVLRGGMDGLDVVQPIGDKNFSSLRNKIKTGEAAGAHDLDGFFALHSALGDLMPLYKANQLAFAHALSTPYRDKRSHFDGQDFLENGGFATNGGLTKQRDGWLNRLLSFIPNSSISTAFSVGRQRLMILDGKQQTSSWSPDSDLDLSPQAQILLKKLYENDKLFASSADIALDLSGKMDSSMGAGRAAKAKALAAFAADRLNEETRIAAFSIGGWDTHRNQSATLPRALKELSAAILTLKNRLGANWDRTAILAMTEFGRTVRENGSAGTDHGTGGAMLMAGGAVAGGKIYGEWPGLATSDLYENRDLNPTSDVRSYAASAIADLFSIKKSTLETSIFPQLDMGEKKRIIL